MILLLECTTVIAQSSLSPALAPWDRLTLKNETGGQRAGLMPPTISDDAKRPRVERAPKGRLEAEEMHALLAAAGVHLTPHLGRHDHFSRRLAAGCRSLVARLRAGHSSTATTMDIYSHAAGTLQHEAVRQPENDFRTLGEPFGGNRVAKTV